MDVKGDWYYTSCQFHEIAVSALSLISSFVSPAAPAVDFKKPYALSTRQNIYEGL